MAPTVLTIAGSDPSGGAGLQADLKTIHQHGAYGAAIPTLITVQNTRGVDAVQVLSAALVSAQLTSLLDDLRPAAAKTGALGSPAIVHAVASVVETTPFPWVVDPVWSTSRGEALFDGDVVEALRSELIPRATVVTPNAEEASRLAEKPVRTLADAAEAARRIAALGPRAVLVKGGHLEGSARGTDVLFYDGRVHELQAASVAPGSFHGTGCALSAAIAARLALGEDIPTAVERAKAWLTASLERAFAVGNGAKPVNHLWPIDEKP